MANQEAKEAASPKGMKDYTPPLVTFCKSSIKIPKIKTPFEINPLIIQIIQSSVQFHGHPHQDPFRHITDFSHICSTFKLDNVSDDTVKLMLFPFSLTGKAKDWLHYCPKPESITTWEALVQQFLTVPASKTHKLRLEIVNFCPYEKEPLHMAWRRYKALLRKCPHHGFPMSTIVLDFYFSLDSMTQRFVDATAGGSIMSKTPEEGYGLLEQMAAKHHGWAEDEGDAHRVEALAAEMEWLSHQFESKASAT